MISSTEIFNISSENLTNLIMDYYSSIESSDSIVGDYNANTTKISSNDPSFTEMINRDIQGDTIGANLKSTLNIYGKLPENKEYFFVYDQNNRLEAVLSYSKQIERSKAYSAEVFEYEKDIRYSRNESMIMGFLNNEGFSYCRYVNGIVSEILKVNGGFGGKNDKDVFKLRLPQVIKATHIIFDGTESRTITSQILYILNLMKTASSSVYKIKYEYDQLNPQPSLPRKKRVIDSQKKLCKKLEKMIMPDMTLDGAVDAFFDVIAEAKPNEEEMLLYEVGCYSFDDKNVKCHFCLVRQTPMRGDEYYQMHMDIIFEAGDNERGLSECKWHEVGDEDLREYVIQSDAYNTLKNQKIHRIEVWVDET